MSLKKYTSSITKNQETSGDDKFMKPPPDKTIGIKNGQYDKMNEKGYIPEETPITNGDVIFGKVTPINDTTNSGKIFKDSSEQYKSHADGVVDRVYTGIKNQDGYETRKALIRSERFPHIGDKFCPRLDKGIEVLCFEGWKLIQDITKNDLVATLVDDKYLSYEYPSEIFRREYEGDMYELRSEHVDLDVTMDHELYAKKKEDNEFSKYTASELYSNTYNLKKNCENNFADIANIKINNAKYDYDVYLDFLGIFITNGHVNQNNRSEISFVNGKRETIDRIYNVAKKLGNDVQSSQKENEYVITSEDLYSKFKELNDESVNKFLPNYVWKLGQRQSRILLNSLMSSDETAEKQIEYFCTSSKRLADDVMKLTIHCGWAGFIETKQVDNRNTFCVKIIKTECEPEINHTNINENDKQSEKVYHYKGTVGCIEVPSHVFMIRQNNKNVWIGNCSRHGLVKLPVTGSNGFARIPRNHKSWRMNYHSVVLLSSRCIYRSAILMNIVSGDTWYGEDIPHLSSWIRIHGKTGKAKENGQSSFKWIRPSVLIDNYNKKRININKGRDRLGPSLVHLIKLIECAQCTVRPS